MRKYIVVICIAMVSIISAQNKKIIYGFDKISQGLLLNPGAETTYKYHIGVPLLSGVSANGNTSGITMADLFRDDSKGIFKGADFTTKLKQALGKLGNDDYAYFNTQIDVLNAGYKINTRDYLSGGFYIEADVFATLPKDIGVLVTEGNVGYVGKTFSLADIAVKADVLGVLHLGLSSRFNNRFTAGGRLKLYSSSVNVTSLDNSGGFRTDYGENNIYEHTLSGLDLSLNTSGVYDDHNESDLDLGKALGGTFFGGNFGVGIDLGFTYHVNNQTEITGSILDLGFVSYSKKLRNRAISGNYVFSGVEFKYDGSSRNYFSELEKQVKDKLPHGENKESYTVLRPVKAYGSYAYSFGKSKNRANCHDNTYKDFFDNTVGGQVFAIVQPQGLNLAYTAFYQRKISKNLNTKLTYTIDDFSYVNFGIGMSVNVWKLNIYGAVDNIFGITDVANEHTSSAQLGVNFIIN